MGRDRRREACGLENSATNPNHGFGLSALALPPNSEKRPHAECSDKQTIFTLKNLRQRFLDPEFAGEAPWRVRSGVRGRRHGDNRLQSKIPFNYGWSSTKCPCSLVLYMHSGWTRTICGCTMAGAKARAKAQAT